MPRRRRSADNGSRCIVRDGWSPVATTARRRGLSRIRLDPRRAGGDDANRRVEYIV